MEKFPLTKRCLEDLEKFATRDMAFVISGCVSQKLARGTQQEELQARLMYEDMLDVRVPENNGNDEYYLSFVIIQM
jgi:hypothetical protein